jgi:hypothetical protein
MSKSVNEPAAQKLAQDAEISVTSPRRKVNQRLG